MVPPPQAPRAHTHTMHAYGGRAYGRGVVRVELVVHEAADDARLAHRLVADEDLRRTAHSRG